MLYVYRKILAFVLVRKDADWKGLLSSVIDDSSLELGYEER